MSHSLPSLSSSCRWVTLEKFWTAMNSRGYRVRLNCFYASLRARWLSFNSEKEDKITTSRRGMTWKGQIARIINFHVKRKTKSRWSIFRTFHFGLTEWIRDISDISKESEGVTFWPYFLLYRNPISSWTHYVKGKLKFDIRINDAPHWYWYCCVGSCENAKSSKLWAHKSWNILNSSSKFVQGFSNEELIHQIDLVNLWIWDE